jgi:plasmid stability protein
MSDVLVRDLEPKTVAALKQRAARSGRSLQAEVKLILEQAARVPMIEARTAAARIRRSLQRTKRQFSDSAELQREDRGR